MKKFIYIILLLSIFLIRCNADSGFLKDLKINNGYMTIDFESLNTHYTVVLNEGEDVINFDYELVDEDSSLIIYNNDNLLVDDHEVVIRVINSKEEKMDYYLEVIHDKSEIVSSFDDEMVPLEGEFKKRVVPLEMVVGSICFLIILLIFEIIFKKSANKIY